MDSNSLDVVVSWMFL